MKRKLLLFISTIFISFSFLNFYSTEIFAAETGVLIEDGTVIDYYEDKPVEEYTEQQLIDIVNQPELKEMIGEGNYYFEDPETLVILHKPKNPEISTMADGAGDYRTVVTKSGGATTSYSPWKIGVEGTGSTSGSSNLTLSKSVGYANSYSGTLAVSKSVFDATVGFNITYSSTTTASYSTSLQKNKTTQIQYRQVNTKQQWKQQLYHNNVNTGYAPTYVTTYKFSHLGYRAVMK